MDVSVVSGRRFVRHNGFCCLFCLSLSRRGGRSRLLRFCLSLIIVDRLKSEARRCLSAEWVVALHEEKIISNSSVKVVYNSIGAVVCQARLCSVFLCRLLAVGGEGCRSRQ